MSLGPASLGEVTDKGQNNDVCWLLLDISSKLLREGNLASL